MRVTLASLLSFLVFHCLLDGFKIGRVGPLGLHYFSLRLQPLDLILSPIGLPTFSYLTLELTFLFLKLNENLFDFKFDSAKFENVVLLQRVLLLDISIAHIAYYKVYFLESIARIFQLLARLCILHIHVLGHELFFLLCSHLGDLLDVSRFNEIAIAYLVDLKEDLGSFTVLLGKVIVRGVDFAVLSDPDKLTRFISFEFLLGAMARLIVEQSLRVTIPCHGFHI